MQREAQLKYELDSDAAAQAARLQELIAASARGDLELPRAHALVARMCKVVQDELQQAAEVPTRGAGGKYKGWLRALPTEIAAVLAIRECIRLCSGVGTHVHIQDLTYNVGRLWELEVRIMQAEAVNPLYMRKVHNQVKERASKNHGHLRRLYNVAVLRVFKGTLDLNLTKVEIMQLGKFGVDACWKAGLIEQIRGTNKNGTMVSYELTPDIANFLRGYTHSDVQNLISREDTRMMCAPDDWTNLTDGGYLSIRRKLAAHLLNIRKMRKSVRSELASTYTAERMPEVFSAGNYLQSVQYSMHEATRDAVLRVWNMGGGVLGVPSKNGPSKPKFPFPDDWVKEDAPENEMYVFNEWKRAAAAHYDELRVWRSKAREIGAFIKATNNGTDKFWFPVYLDSRGRWYYRGTPNPQGSDMAKAVLHFGEKRTLGKRGLYWLKVSIANAYGYDKVRFDERAAWTDENFPAMERALDSPEDYPEVWGTDAPWCMFSAAWELREAYRSGNPEAYCTGIPVHMDATCSGLQHFSALLRDDVGAQYVNLVDLGLPQKQDIYTKVANTAEEYIRKDLDNPKLRELAQWVLQVGISRDVAKKPVMTYVYSATLRGTAEYIRAELQSSVLPAKGMQWLDEFKSFEHSMYIAKALFKGIEETVPAAAEAMRWLRSVAGEKPNGVRMQWTAPSGFVVQHDYQDYTDSKVRLNSCGVVQVVARDWNEGTRTHAMQNAISPNFVHALDAAHLTGVANSMCNSGLLLVAVHDSFGTHACDVDALHTHIRQEFYNMYEDGCILQAFLDDVHSSATVPSTGTLDLTSVLTSEFMFC